jgi:hypothetical protein
VDHDQANFVLIGGQAVYYWAEKLLRVETGEDIPLPTSRDIDFLGDSEAVLRCAKLLEGKPMLFPKPVDPIAGTVSYMNAEGQARTIDFLKRAHGLSVDDIRETALPVDVDSPSGEPSTIWIMHPERIMESRLANLSLPGKDSELALNQLRVAIACARQFMVEVVLRDEDRSDRADIAMAHNERVAKAAKAAGGLRAFHEFGIDVMDALVVDDRLSENHLAKRVPQLRHAVETARGKTGTSG